MADRNWFDVLVDSLAMIAGIAMCLLTILVCADVAARYFRLFPMPWSLDVAEYALLLITFLGAPWVLANRGHISIDILLDTMTLATKARVLKVTYSIGAIICGVLCFFSVKVLHASWSQNTMVHETFVYPEFLMFLIPPPIFLMLMWIFIRWLRDPNAAEKHGASSGL